jgi:hypothetical protein
MNGEIWWKNNGKNSCDSVFLNLIQSIKPNAILKKFYGSFNWNFPVFCFNPVVLGIVQKIANLSENPPREKHKTKLNFSFLFCWV